MKTRYVVSVYLNVKDEADFRATVELYNRRQRYSADGHVELVGRGEESQSSYPAISPDTYVTLELACTDVKALLEFGEFRGNKTMQRWERENKRDKA